MSVRHGRQRRVAGLALLLLLVLACSPSASPGAARDQSSPEAAPARGPKILRVAIAREPEVFVLSLAANPSRSGGTTQPLGFVANKLQNFDDKGRNYPELAAALPTVADGTWKINGDGTMETVWTLRPNVKWHDGTPMTADDLVFGYQLVTTPGVPSTAGTFVRLIGSVAAQDSSTVVVTWTQLFVDADKPNDNLPVLPRHLLEGHLANPDGLLNLPYWTTEYVGTGPFKLDRWERGERLEFSAFGDYYSGRPKLDRIIVRIIADANAQVANILAGEVDLTLPTGIDTETALAVKDRWEGTGNQVLLASSGQLRHAAPQMREEFVRPRAMLDPRVRQAVFRALDRQAVSDAVSRGTAPPADSIVAPFYDVRRDLEPAISPFPFDVAAAQRVFQEAGWTKGGDGVLRNTEGEEFRLEIAGGQSGRIDREEQAIALGWRQVGMQVDFFVFSQASAGDNEARSPYSGVEIGGATLELFLSTRKSCRTIPAPGNGWRGNNRSGYCNPEFESLLDRLQITIPPEERLPLMREAIRLTMTDMAVFPLYWDVDPILVVAGVRGVPLPTQPLQIHTWNSSQWDRE